MQRSRLLKICRHASVDHYLCDRIVFDEGLERPKPYYIVQDLDHDLFTVLLAELSRISCVNHRFHRGTQLFARMPCVGISS